MYHILVYKALKRAEHSSREGDGSCEAEMFLVLVSLKGIESVFLLKNRKMQLKRCDHSNVPPNREKILTRNKELDHFAEF